MNILFSFTLFVPKSKRRCPLKRIFSFYSSARTVGRTIKIIRYLKSGYSIYSDVLYWPWNFDLEIWPLIFESCISNLMTVSELKKPWYLTLAVTPRRPVNQNSQFNKVPLKVGHKEIIFITCESCLNHKYES
jgi:hypothetical protein